MSNCISLSLYNTQQLCGHCHRGHEEVLLLDKDQMAYCHNVASKTSETLILF